MSRVEFHVKFTFVNAVFTSFIPIFINFTNTNAFKSPCRSLDPKKPSVIILTDSAAAQELPLSVNNLRALDSSDILSVFVLNHMSSQLILKGYSDVLKLLVSQNSSFYFLLCSAITTGHK